MAKSRKALREEVKEVYMEKLMEILSNDEDVMRVKSNEFAFPIIDSEGNEDFVVVKVSIPTGANKGAEPYDAYALAEEYQMKCEEKKAKAEETRKKKEAKIKRDEERRRKEEEISKKKKD